MIFGKEKVKSITVTANDQYVVWDIDVSNVARDAILDVSQGCIAIYVVNGVLKSNNPAGRWVINGKEEQKYNSKLQLIGVNADRTFDVLCGVGGVPFKDYEINAETNVGAHGECKIRIYNPWTLCGALGKTNIRVEDIDEYISTKMSEILTTSLAAVLQKYDYSSINTQLSAISAEMKGQVSVAFEAIGIGIESFSIKGIHFPDEYKAKREKFFDAENERRAAKEARREKERADRAEAEVIGTIMASRAKAPQNEAKSKDVAANVPVQYCPKCGMKISIDALFCPGCGKKLR